jgi:hypothetical protein
MANAFGKLNGTIDPAFFQVSKAQGTSGPAPEVAKNKWARTLTCSEPKSDVPWAADKMKKFNGEDDVDCRGLNSDDDSYKPAFFPIFQCNKVPTIDEPNDPAIARRMTMVELPFKFIDMEQLQPGHPSHVPWDPRECKQMDKSLKQKFKNEPRFAMAFFVLLTRVYRQFVVTMDAKGSLTMKDADGNLIFPREWSAKRKSYLAATDGEGKWIGEKLEMLKSLKEDNESGLVVKHSSVIMTPSVKKNYALRPWWKHMISFDDVYNQYKKDVGDKKVQRTAF